MIVIAYVEEDSVGFGFNLGNSWQLSCIGGNGCSAGPLDVRGCRCLKEVMATELAGGSSLGFYPQVQQFWDVHNKYRQE